MKTNNNIKNIGRVTLLLLAELLISTGILTAQNDIVSSSEYNNDIAYTISSNNLSLEFHSTTTEKPTEIEAWMTSTNFWENIKKQLESESPLEIEPWMSSTDFWTGLDPNESENNLSIENWMTDSDFWSELKMNYEKPIQIETWMTDTNLWNKDETSHKIECWMLDTNYWNELKKEDVAEIESWMTDKSFWIN